MTVLGGSGEVVVGRCDGVGTGTEVTGPACCPEKELMTPEEQLKDLMPCSESEPEAPVVAGIDHWTGEGATQQVSSL